MKEYMSIGEFAREIGVSESTLRNWDKNGKLTPHHRTKGNQRIYSRDQAEQFLAEPKVRVIQGKKKRDVYYYHTNESFVEDKVGNRLYIRDDMHDVQDLVIQEYMDYMFHNVYFATNNFDAEMEAMRKVGDIEWVRMT